MRTIQLRNEEEEGRKDQVSPLRLALGDTRDKPSTITAHCYLVIKGLQRLQPLPDAVINTGGLSSH